MDIRSVLRFEGNKPHMGEYVIATTNRGVRSWNVTGCVYKGHRGSD